MGITNTATSITAAGLTLGATWYHTYTVKKLARVAGQKATLATLLLRDGKQMLTLSLQSLIWTFLNRNYLLWVIERLYIVASFTERDSVQYLS